MLDVLIVTYLIYRIYKLLRGSIAFNIFVGLVFLYATWWLVSVLNMQLLSTFLSQFVSLGVILLVLIFQPEIRRFLLDLGNTTLNRRSNFLRRFFGNQLVDSTQDRKVVLAIRNAILNMSRTQTGALIVLGNSDEGAIMTQSGVHLNANINDGLLESLFHKSSSLHDGAVVIQGNKIHSASVVLPISSRTDLPPGVGLRHRAGVGVTESSEAACIIVSEQDGTISTAVNGDLQRNVDPEQLEKFIMNHL